MKNPLYPSNIITDTLSNYSRCLVITLEKDPQFDIFLETVENINYYNNIKNNYCIKAIPLWMIKSITNYRNEFIIFDISEDDLLKFNFEVKDINNNIVSYNLNEAIILLPDHNWSWFFEQIEPCIRDGIKDIFVYLHSAIINENTIQNVLNNNTTLKYLNNIEYGRDVMHWKDIYKCQLNITPQWLNRDINFSDAKDININTRKQMEDRCTDYLKDIIKKHNYVDASSGIKTHKYRLYYMDEYENIPIGDLLLKLKKLSINENTRTKLTETIINACLISKKYVQCILKNKKMLQYINLNFNQYKKAFSYAWLMMYIEEGILKSYIKEEDRCVFTLDEAVNIPTQESNILIPLMVEKKYISVFGGYRSNINRLGKIANMNEFKERFNRFVTKEKIDVFKGMNWKNLGISGSIIPATCRSYDPLQADNKFTLDEYFDTFYKDSDIDIMCDLADYKSFFDKVYYLISVLNMNINELYPLAVVKYETTKTAALHLSRKYINENHGGVMTDVIAHGLYKKLKSEEPKHEEEKYKKINEVVSIDNFKYYVYNVLEYDDKKYPNYSENIKFHVSSPYLARNFEIFKIKYTFLGTVSRFHLPCVRGYYDGSNVYLLPSAITALTTGMCMDYKYFAGVRSPFEIILKYVFRGYSIILNKKEMIKMVEYIKNTEKWKNMYKWDDTYRLGTFNSYYTHPKALLNKPDIKYKENMHHIEYNLLSPIISVFGYVIPYA
jgi:hypothetical protein